MTEWIITSSVLILLVIVLRGLFKEKMKARYTYALWLIVLVRLLCPVNFGEASFGLLSLAEKGQELLESQLQNSQNGQPVVDSLTGNSNVRTSEPEVIYHDASNDILDLTTNSGTQNVKAQVDFNIAAASSDTLFVIWVVGISVMAIVVFGVNLSFGMTLGLFRKELPEFTRKGRRNKKLFVFLADGIESSCLYGVIHPTIYLNKKGMKEQEKTYCVEHEYSHYLQGDMFWSLCRTLCLILHWYNPLVWLAVTLSKKDAEIACDERTIERLGEEERYAYGHTLVELAAGHSRAVKTLGMATLMNPDKKEVEDRVKAISKKKQTKIITAIMVALAVTVVGFFTFTGEARGEEPKKAATPTVTPTAVPTDSKEEEASEVTSITDRNGEEKKIYTGTVVSEKTYTELTFTDHIKLEPKKGEGWLIDLNGDGTQEKLYLSDSAIYINNKLMFIMESGKSLSLMDVDTTDNIYELCPGTGSLFIYDGTELEYAGGISRHVWADGDTYTGGIAEFERIDEHTISFENYYADFYNYWIRGHYRLNENHELVLVQQVYDLEKTDSFLYRGTMFVDAPLRLYAERDLNGEYVEVSEAEVFDITKWDAAAWMYVESEKYGSGWLYYGSDEALDYLHMQLWGCTSEAYVAWEEENNQKHAVVIDKAEDGSLVIKDALIVDGEYIMVDSIEELNLPDNR